MLFVVALVFYLTLRLTNNESEARALSFCTLIFSNLLLILSSRSMSKPIYETVFEKNKAFWFVALGALIFLGLSLYVPVLRGVFKFEQLHLMDGLIAFGAAGLSVVWFEVVKYFNYKKDGKYL